MAIFLIDHEYKLDIIPSARPQLVPVSEYDVGRTFTFTITYGGEEMAIPSTYGAVTVEGTIGSYAFSEPASIENGKIVFQLTESMTAHAGKAWTKIKFANADAPVSTCAFFLAVDRAGVEADTVIGASGFEQQIVNAVNNWLDLHPPSGGGGLTDEAKQALLDCFENVAWINDDGQTYYDALYAALYPPADVLSISAVFTQGSAVIYDTDSLNTLRQYLVVTATMTDSTTRTVTDYTLSGTLTVGTSTITVSYGGKTATFSVAVTENIWDDPNKWSLNTGIYTENVGQPFSDIQAPVDKRLLLTNPIELQPNKTYVLSCAENYTLFVAMVDSNGIYRGKVSLPAPTGTQITSNSYVPNVSFNTDSYSWISVCVQTPATATAADVSAANVKLVEADQTPSNLEWSLNKAIYSARFDEPFADIQATVDKRMLLTSLISLESGKKYAVCCSADYLMYCIGIDANGIYKHYINNGYQADYLTNSTVFENTEGYTQMSIAVKTSSTATQADVAAVNIKMAVVS